MRSAPDAATGLRGRRVLLTGGAGFVGTNLALRLARAGADVHLLVRPGGSRWRLEASGAGGVEHVVDLLNRGGVVALVRALRPEAVFHLAAGRDLSDSAWLRITEVNVRAALHLVEALHAVPGATLVSAGSSLEYGPAARPHREDDPPRPESWHGVGKAAADAIFRQAAVSMGLPVMRLRIFHVYGPWEAGHRLLPTVIAAAHGGGCLALTAARSLRDWVFVDDVVEALLAASACPSPGDLVNIGSGEAHASEDVVSLVEELTGRAIERAPYAHAPHATDPAFRCADIAKAREVLGWAPRTDLRAGVAATLSWVRANPGARAAEPRVRPTLV